MYSDPSLHSVPLRMTKGERAQDDKGERALDDKRGTQDDTYEKGKTLCLCVQKSSGAISEP